MTRSHGNLRRTLFSPAFVVAVTILGICAVGLNASVQYLKLHFRKLPVPMQQELRALPATIGPWQQVSIDQPLSPAIEEVLGTSEYIFRDYVDTRVVPEARMRDFEGKTAHERQVLLRHISAEYPQAVVGCWITYYTGAADTVAHIPDRCYIADGYRPASYRTPTLALDGESPRDLTVRMIDFEHGSQAMGHAEWRNVAYFFQVNGRYEANPLGVRQELQNLFQKYGYYAKIELMMSLREQEVATESMRDFLSHALPEIEALLPNWEEFIAEKSDDAGAPRELTLADEVRQH